MTTPAPSPAPAEETAARQAAALSWLACLLLVLVYGLGVLAAVRMGDGPLSPLVRFRGGMLLIAALLAALVRRRPAEWLAWTVLWLATLTAVLFTPTLGGAGAPAFLLPAAAVFCAIGGLLKTRAVQSAAQCV